MKVNSIQSYNCAKRNLPKRNVANQNNVSFGKLIGQVAADSFGPQVQKNVNTFMSYMQELTNKAFFDDKAKEKLTSLIGEKSTNALLADKVGYTKALDKESTKLFPLSGQGVRGAKIRNMIADSLGINRTAKSDIPLPAIIGNDASGKPIYLTTTNNELMHMMEAGVLSPFEKVEWINTEKSDGDITVIVEGLKQGILPKDRPAVFTYTDDVGTKGFEDYSKLIERIKELGNDTQVKAIARGHMASKEDAADILGTFIKRQDGKGYEVIEKPTIEVLNERIPGDGKVATNIGKTLITPRGLADIEARIPAKGLDEVFELNTLAKMDKGEPKWHMTEGVLKPAAQTGDLDVIEKHAQFSDIGNGEVFTDIMSQIADGSFKNVFPEKLEAQIRENVKLAPDGLSVTLKYGDKTVTLPTTKGKIAVEQLAQNV